MTRPRAQDAADGLMTRDPALKGLASRRPDAWADFLRRLLVTASLAGAAATTPPEEAMPPAGHDPAEPASRPDGPAALPKPG